VPVSIAHEINQPLWAVVNNASACVRWLTVHNLEEARQSASLVVPSHVIRRTFLTLITTEVLERNMGISMALSIC
jgi:hypothetical protein